jgi:hypothetical protein
MMRRLPALTTLVLVGAVAAAATAPAFGSPPRPGHSTITGGHSKITLSKATRKAMADDAYTLTAVSPAKFNGKTLTSPIKSGTFTIAPQHAAINTAGGFTISHGGASVSITKVKSTSNGSSGSGTGVVSGHGRIKVIITGEGSPSLGNNSVTVSGFPVTLAKPLIKVLDNKFGTKLFKAHAKIGKGDATFTYKN